MLYYIHYSAGYSILCVLSYVLRSAYRPTISRAYSYTPAYPTVLTIVHSDGTPPIPPQYMDCLQKKAFEILYSDSNVCL
jgi:hypothetical protein